MNKINRTVLLFVLFLGLLTQTVFASLEKENTLEDVEISVDFPFHKKLYLHERNWTTLNITVQNYAQDKIIGKLQLYKKTNYSRSEKLIMEEEIELAVQESNTYSFTIPVLSLQHKPFIRLVTEEQKEAFYDLQEVRSMYGDAQIAIVSQEGNDFHFLKSLENEYIRFHSTRYMSVNELPEEFWLYQESMVALGNLGGERIQPKQVEALIDWVKSGGVLLISGGEAFLPYAQDLADLLPLSNLRLESLSNMEDLLEEAGIENPPIEMPAVLVGEKKEAAAIFPNPSTPLFASQRLGNGLVIFSLYDVTTEPMASWQGNKKVWERVLERFAVSYTIFKKHIYHNDLMSLERLSEQIPGLHAPSIKLITIIWVIYLLLIGPFLYIFLKKVDKREWAWLIIPCLVMVTATSVYMLGVQRIGDESSSNLVSTIQIYDQDLARIDSNASFFVLEGNDFDVLIPNDMQVAPAENRAHQVSIKSFVRANQGQRFLRFENVPYMSLVQTKSLSYSKEIGYIEHELIMEDNRLTGIIKNSTSLDLEEVEVQVGTQSYKLGSLARNETKDVHINLAKFYYTEYKQQEPYRPFIEVIEAVNTIYPSNFQPPAIPTIDLYAVSHSPIEGVRIEGQEVKENFKQMILQELVLAQPQEGQKAIFPYGTLPVYITNQPPISGDYIYGEGILTSGSSIALGFQVQLLSMDVHKLQIPIHEVAFSPFSIKILNVRSNEWEEVDQSQALELTDQELETYVTGQGRLTLLFENNSSENFQLPFPYIMAEGEWKS